MKQMGSYKLFSIILPLSIALSSTGCTAIKDSTAVPTENTLSTEVTEHTISFEAHGDLPLVNCTLNGNKAVPFLVDTGASTSIIDYNYAEAIGVIPTSEQYHSLQGHLMRDASIDELKIGAFGLKNVHARVMNLADVLPDDFPAKGILGYPLFRRIELCIDYPRRTISFREGACRRLERSFDPVFTFVMLPVLVENQGPFNFILDTGSNMSLVEPHVLAELNPPKEAVPVVRIKMEGPGEGFCWPRKVGASDGKGNARQFIRRACGVRIDGVLGWRHMKDYRITINYPTCTYQFEKVGYPPELKPVVVNVTPDLSKDVHLPVTEIVLEFSVPMSQFVSYLTTFECDHRWRNDRQLVLAVQEELLPGKEYELILGQGLSSKNDVPLDWTAYRFKVVLNQ